MTDTYNASSIHIASDEEILDRWDWAKVGHWAQQYRVPAEWLERAVEACRRAGVAPEYLEQRYLRQDASVPLDEAVDAAMREIRDEDQRRQSRVSSDLPLVDRRS
jgi:hypothetical protein